MKAETIFCKHCNKKTNHINSICLECGYKNNKEVEVDFIKTKEEKLDLLK